MPKLDKRLFYIILNNLYDDMKIDSKNIKLLNFSFKSPITDIKPQNN
jgi:hypothetical protein